MATAGVIIGGAVANALAFSLAGKLIHTSDSKRHNLEMEHIAKERDKWNQERMERIDLINKTLRRQNHAAKTFNNLEEAGEAYYQVTGKRLPPLRAEPREQKDAELGVIVAIMAITGIVAYKFL